LQEQIKERKKSSKPDDPELKEMTANAAQLSREANELLGKAQGIEDAAYDLKAVNPNAKNHEDTRTPEELLDVIESKGREVEAALATLRKKSKDVIAS
jgi:type I restriction enzyme M protein